MDVMANIVPVERAILHEIDRSERALRASLLVSFDLVGLVSVTKSSKVRSWAEKDVAPSLGARSRINVHLSARDSEPNRRDLSWKVFFPWSPTNLTVDGSDG